MRAGGGGVAISARESRRDERWFTAPCAAVRPRGSRPVAPARSPYREVAMTQTAQTPQLARLRRAVGGDVQLLPSGPPGSTVYISGQLSHDDKANFVGEGDFELQVRTSLANLDRVLEHLGPPRNTSSRPLSSRRGCGCASTTSAASTPSTSVSAGRRATSLASLNSRFRPSWWRSQRSPSWSQMARVDVWWRPAPFVEDRPCAPCARSDRRTVLLTCSAPAAEREPATWSSRVPLARRCGPAKQ